MRADIDYGFAIAQTIFGVIGVKTWVYRGNVLPGEMAQRNIKPVSRFSADEDEQQGQRRKKRR